MEIVVYSVKKKTNHFEVLLQQFIRPLVELIYIQASKKRQQISYISLRKTIPFLMETSESQPFCFYTSLNEMEYSLTEMETKELQITHWWH